MLVSKPQEMSFDSALISSSCHARGKSCHLTLIFLLITLSLQLALYVWRSLGEPIPELEKQLQARDSALLRPKGDAWKSFVPDIWTKAAKTRDKGPIVAPRQRRISQAKDGVETPERNLVIEGIDWTIADKLFEEMLTFLALSEEERRSYRGDRLVWKRMIAATSIMPKATSNNPPRDYASFIAYAFLELAISRTQRVELFRNTPLGEMRREMQEILNSHVDPSFTLSLEDTPTSAATEYIFWEEPVALPNAPHTTADANVNNNAADKENSTDANNKEADKENPADVRDKEAPKDKDAGSEDDSSEAPQEDIDNEEIQDIIKFVASKDVSRTSDDEMDFDVIERLEDLVIVSNYYIALASQINALNAMQAMKINAARKRFRDERDDEDAEYHVATVPGKEFRYPPFAAQRDQHTIGENFIEMVNMFIYM